MNHAAQAYRPGVAASAYGRCIRNVFIQRSYRDAREPAINRTFHYQGKNHHLHIRYQHQDLRPILTPRDEPELRDRARYHGPYVAAALPFETPLGSTAYMHAVINPAKLQIDSSRSCKAMDPELFQALNSGAELFQNSIQKTASSTSSWQSEYPAPPDTRARAHSARTHELAHIKWVSVMGGEQDSCPPSPTPAILVVGTSGTSSWAGMGDFHKSTANRFESSHAHTSVTHIEVTPFMTKHPLTNTTWHDTNPCGKILIKADEATDQVVHCDPVEWVTNSMHLSKAMEAAQLDVVAVSGDGNGHPGVVPTLETHPYADSDWRWSKATATPWPLGDGLTWSRDHKIYQAPSPTDDCGNELICKHGALHPQGTTVSKGSTRGEFSRVDDSIFYAQPSGIGGGSSEDSTMYFEYESVILRITGARGLFTANEIVNASNAKSPQSGTNYLQRTTDLVHATTMEIESKIAMAGCFISTVVDFARATATKTLERWQKR